LGGGFGGNPKRPQKPGGKIKSRGEKKNLKKNMKKQKGFFFFFFFFFFFENKNFFLYQKVLKFPPKKNWKKESLKFF